MNVSRSGYYKQLNRKGTTNNYQKNRIALAEDINIAINGYIKYFNTQRLAYSLQYKTPVQYRTEQGFI